MNLISDFKPVHCDVKKTDTEGNNGKGRIFIIPGSLSRAKYIVENYLNTLTTRESSRGHHLYLGKYQECDVGVVSTGMGCPSLDIIVSELIQMGAKHFIRIGTAGSFSSKLAKVGSVVIANAAVRDEGTSLHYAPLEFPAVANREMVNALVDSAKSNGSDYSVGIIHTKSSLFAREFHTGVFSEDQKKYMETLKNLGVLASEMESSHLFVLGSTYGVNCSSICSIIGDDVTPFSEDQILNKATVDHSIKIVLGSLDIYLQSY